jgi:hypothetical protein
MPSVGERVLVAAGARGEVVAGAEAIAGPLDLLEHRPRVIIWAWVQKPLVRLSNPVGASVTAPATIAAWAMAKALGSFDGAGDVPSRDPCKR